MGERGKALFQPLGVPAEIQEHPAAQGGFPVDQQVHQRGALHLLGVKGPLVALEEHQLQCPLGPQGFRQELPLPALPVHGDVPGQHLLVGAGDVPAELYRSQAVLPLLQVAPGGAGLQGQAGGTRLAGGIDRAPIGDGRAAGGQHHLAAEEHRQAPVLLGKAAFVQSHQPCHAALLHQQPHRLEAVQQGDALLPHRGLQLFRHDFGGQRPAGGGPLPGVVVGLVAHVFPVAVGGEGHPQVYQLHKGAHRARRLRQGRVPVDAAPGKEVFRQLVDAVLGVGAQGELVIGLLVAACVPGGAHVHPLGEQGDVPPAQVEQGVRGVKARAARAHHHGVQSVEGHPLAPQGDFLHPLQPPQVEAAVGV